VGTVPGLSCEIYRTRISGSLIGREIERKLLRYLALVFIDAFGITPPSMEKRDRAATYIALLMIGLLITLCSAFLLALKILRV
jgi:hypothetical protein